MDYRINYNNTKATRGDAPVDNNIYNDNDEAIILGANNLEREHYKFMGWRLREHTNYDGIIKPSQQDFNEGDVLKFISQELIDGDGNIYTTIVIGNQEWSVENLKSTKYMDGTDIPFVISGWDDMSTPAANWYNNNPEQGYGALYNWYVVDPDNPKQIAPEGWRVPTDADWTALEDYLIANGYNWDGTTEGNKIGKAIASNGGEWWGSSVVGRVGNDQVNNNSSGFSALPGGFRYYYDNFFDIEEASFWWTTTEYEDPTYSYCRLLYNQYEYLYRSYYPKSLGMSVRLVRDI